MGTRRADEMRVAVTLIVLSAGSGLLAAPQFEADGAVKNLFSSLASGGGGQDEESGSEKVPYTTLKQFDGYEMRLYPSVKWACTELTYEREEEETEVVNVEDDEAAATLKALQEYSSSKRDRKNKPQYKMFMKLFRYISGVNKEQEEVAMTAPVLTSLKLLANNQVTKEMCFYMEQKHQANPPTPVDPDVKIDQQGVHRLRAQIWRLCHEGRSQHQGGAEVCRGVGQRWGGRGQVLLLHGWL